jgi:hypothetical protein
MRGLSAVVAVISTLGWVSSAEAIISKKRWDPKYNTEVSGTGLGDLGWSGTVDFEIKDDCLLTINESQWINNLSFGACGNKLSIQSATVTLYEFSDESNNVLLSYDGSSKIFGGDNSQLAIRMYVEVNGSEKTLTAVQGGFLVPEVTTASFAVVATYDAAAYWLNFNANEENNFPLIGKDAKEAPDGDFAFLTSCSFNYPKNKTLGSGVNCSQNDGVAWPAALQPVPEPETYLLGLASFGVLGVWARRRRLSGR